MSQQLKFGKFSLLSISIGCSFFFSLILSEVSAVRYLEFLVQDRLMLWQQSKDSPTDNIALIGLRERDLIGAGGEQTRYAALVRRLLEEEATVVVLNLLDNWVNEISADENLPLRELIQEYNERIVLVTPTTPVSQSNITEIETYHHLLPPLVGNNIRSIYDVTEIQGFYEFEKDASSLEGPARLAHLESIFYYNDPTFGQTQGKFYSALSLALVKYQQQISRNAMTNWSGVSELAVQQWPIKIPFFGDMDIFPNFHFDQLCLTFREGRCLEKFEPRIEEKIRGKVAIVGFIAPEQNTKALLSVESPRGQPMPGIVVQANILAGLMSARFSRIPPSWIMQLAVITGAAALGHLIDWAFQRYSLSRYQFISLLILAILGLYGAFALVFAAQQLVFPIFLPIMTWFSTALVIQGWLTYRAQQILIVQQQYEITQLKSAESTAIVLQTRKLLHRIASGIHEGPLQDLRLVMDQLELELSSDQDSVIDKLSNAGQSIRHYLQNIRSMAEQLEVTPRLRQGLVAGIRHYLSELQAMGKLTLVVQDRMEPLEETLSNSQWLDAREDIFMFFREAMTNIIMHAQPPHGDASQVIISLTVKNHYCTLTIENDAINEAQSAAFAVPSANWTAGYGTKMMETVARELPDGHWEASVLETGGYQVQLTWQHSIML